MIRPKPKAEIHGTPGTGAGPADRCPFPRPFPPDFAGCPTHQPVIFTPVDSMHKPLASTVTCRHLSTAPMPENGRGRFYGRCALGAPAQRLGWLSLVTPARLEVVRALQEEFDEATRESRDALVQAKVALLDHAGAEARATLEERLTAFLDTVRSFLAARADRFADAGLPTEPLLRLVEDWCREWSRSRDFAVPRISDEVLAAFPKATLAFVGPLADAPWHDLELLGHSSRGDRDGAGEARTEASAKDGGDADSSGWAPVLDEPMLRIVPMAGGGVRIIGEIDAANADVVAHVLDAALPAFGDRHLDLSGLVFCDIAGLRALLGAAYGGDSGRLVLHGTSAQLRRTMEIAGWDSLPNVVVVAAGSAEG